MSDNKQPSAPLVGEARPNTNDRSQHNVTINPFDIYEFDNISKVDDPYIWLKDPWNHLLRDGSVLWYKGEGNPNDPKEDDEYFVITDGLIEYYKYTGGSYVQQNWGQAVPGGGTTDQVLSKNSATDYDTSWQDLPTILGTAPDGGDANQILTKDTGTDYDYSWQDPAGLEKLDISPTGAINTYHTIATAPSGRASGLFTLTNTDAQHHQTVVFYASVNFGVNPEITVVSNSMFGETFDRLRLGVAGTSDGATLQLRIGQTGGDTSTIRLEQKYQWPGWTLADTTSDLTGEGITPTDWLDFTLGDTAPFVGSTSRLRTLNNDVRTWEQVWTGNAATVTYELETGYLYAFVGATSMGFITRTGTTTSGYIYGVGAGPTSAAHYTRYNTTNDQCYLYVNGTHNMLKIYRFGG